MVEGDLTLIITDEKKKKIKSVTWNFRADENLKKETQIIVDAKKGTNDEVSMTQYVMDSIKSTNEGRDYDSLTQKLQVSGFKVTELEKENNELKLLTTKKIPTFKRISIAFSKEEYDIIVKASHEANAQSPSKFLKQKLVGKDKSLSQIIPKSLESL